MPRAARVVIPECPHHVTQRGNNHQDVFFVDDDRRVFLQLLGEAAEEHGVLIDGYCLMTNHVHLIATPAAEHSLAGALKWTNQVYAQYVNRLHGRSGHLWQSRFYSCALDAEHTRTAMAYVERNPIRAGLCQQAWDWPWSSAAAHCGWEVAFSLPGLEKWAERASPEAWQKVLNDPQDEAQISRLRQCVLRGRPLGSDAFVAKLESLLGRRLRPLPHGRPRKKAGDPPKS